MDLILTIALASATLGAVLALLRLLPSRRPRAAVWIDSLLLFFLASAVCDTVAWLQWGSSLHLNPYAVAAGYLLIGAAVGRARAPQPA
jgi:hypothetical protein